MGIMERLDAVTENALSQDRIVGSVVLVSRHGELTYSRAAGMADRHNIEQTELDTIFRLASLTKPLVAATILAMMDEGHFGLDDSISEYLPYFTPTLEDGEQPQITIQHLLTHTAGLQQNLDLTEEEKQQTRFIKIEHDYWQLSLEDNMKRLASRPLLFKPGKGWAYSAATHVLGALAAKIIGGTLQDAVLHYVTGPLGMRDTAFGVQDGRRLAAAYANDVPVPVQMSDPHNIPNEWGGITSFSPGRILDDNVFQAGGGGMAGTAPDFLTFLNSLLGHGVPILKPETVYMATMNQIGDVLREDAGQRFGFFGAVLDDPIAAATPQNRGTFAWGGIFGSTWFVDPKEGLAVVALTNTAPEGCSGAYPNELRDAVYG